MKIERALQLKVGDYVDYPADRGEPGDTGQVASVSQNVNHNHLGRPFIWVEVKYRGINKKAVWPSNRLGAR